ncbi:uncharacterized protein LOC133326243, partial [Musca vetustissima]|uniref:uncharacterized protein LOC133326243 n=1 Tax=Musca vetustissima TaxID=27455 RepID=UPI002AB67F88
MVTILFMNFNYYEFTTNINQRRFYTTTTATNSTKLLRFHDFEPRNYVKIDTDMMFSPDVEKNQISRKLSSKERKSRGFQFHADEKDVSIELEFIIPFLRVPIERSMSVAKTALRSLFNLNVSSLLTTGAIVAVGGIFAILLKFLFTPFLPPGYPVFRKTSRNSGEYPQTVWNTYNNTDEGDRQNILSFVETKLHERNINLGTCMQKSICDYIQKSSYDPSGSIGKVIDGMLSLDSIRNILSGTAVNSAVDAARNGEDC